MRLSEYLARHAPDAIWGSPLRVAPTALPEIQAFVFGERYWIVGKGSNGMRIALPDLEVALAILRTESLAQMNVDPWACLGQVYCEVDGEGLPLRNVSNDPLTGMLRTGGSKRLALSVIGMGRAVTYPWTPDELDTLVANTRRLVTLYSLTGSWNAMAGAKGNL